MKNSSRKPFKNTNELLELLSTRGVDISNANEDMILERNYYKLINGYKDLFLEKRDIEKYKPGTKLEDIVNLFDFDTEISAIVLKYILECERIITSVYAHKFCMVNGSNGYDDLRYFSAKGVSKQIKKSRLKRLKKWIKTSDSETIKHYSNINKRDIPFWVVIDSLPLGQVKGLFDMSPKSVQVEVAQHFGLSSEKFSRYFKAIYIARNKTAHSNRFYSIVNEVENLKGKNETRRKINVPITTQTQWARLDKITNEPVSGRSDVAAIFMSIGYILGNEKFKQLLSEIDAILGKYSFGIVSMSNIKFIMGIPKSIFDMKL